MRTKRILGIISLALTLTAFSAGGALADGGGPGGPHAGRAALRGLVTGPTGAKAGLRAFTCERARGRIALLNRGIAIVNARIQSGKAQNPEGAARLVQLAKARAAQINARIAANCS